MPAATSRRTVGGVVGRPGEDGRPGAVGGVDRSRGAERVVQGEHGRVRAAQQQRHAPGHHGAQGGGARARQDGGPREPGDAVAVPRVADRDRQVRRESADTPRRDGERRRDEGALDEPVSADRLDRLGLVAGRLEVDVGADPRGGEQREDVVERRSVGAYPLGVVRDAQAGRDVELDDIDAGRDRGLERLDRVLGCNRTRSAVADHERTSRRAPQLERHAVRRMTTTAQSSGRASRANARDAASTASAISWAGRPALDASASSSRATPNSSVPILDSTTPSV